MSEETTASLRQELRHYLAGLDPAEHDHLVSAAIGNFLETPEYRRCRHIAAFYPVRHELNLLPLIETCWSDDKQVYLPCLMPKPFQKMYFLPFRPDTPLKHNRYHIPEPALSARQQAGIRQLDIVITPLLAFGPHGERLGMGGGYYDRTFAFQNRAIKHFKPRLWAIALEAQAREFATNPWDVNIHAVATETGVHRYV